MQEGHLIINNDVSIFDFKTRTAQEKVNRFIKSVSGLIYAIEQPVGYIQPLESSTESSAPLITNNDLKFCHSCGQKIKKTSAYCEFCGSQQ